MKKILLFISVIIITTACQSHANNYEGYIYDNKKRPIENIKICEIYNSNCVVTDSKGFFYLKKDPSSINDLIVYRRNIPIDTIKTVWTQHGEQVNYSFVNLKKDTLFIDIKKLGLE